MSIEQSGPLARLLSLIRSKGTVDTFLSAHMVDTAIKKTTPHLKVVRKQGSDGQMHTVIRPKRGG